ncbi:MAG: phosphoenolpyruvate--protein phosphotransferase [Alphaproteobacteria bacterium]|nr:phosphoenolpyruvate--protein phosphotransferase [Alphaproteobacteria bacterium]
MTGPTPGAARLILRRLREVMAEGTSAQARLDKIVRVVAANVVAEVCSIYIVVPGGELELFATEGLNPSAVHRTRMKKGEGLVGDIALNARPLNLADAQSHPNFSYKPETGEDPFQSFVGVPILRGGRALGVLVVQNKTRRVYDEEEVETLQTIAMVLAEMVGAGDLVDPTVLEETGLRRDRPFRIRGTPIADGVAIGQVVLHEPRVVVERLIAEDLGHERQRLARAIEELRAFVDDILSAGPTLEGETRDVLEAYQMFANDSGWVERIREAIDTGLTAEAAVEKVHSETRARLLRQSDPYLRERLHDLDDLANRLLRHLAGVADTASRLALPPDAVLIARSMGPAELLEYDRARIQAVVLEEGSPTSHVAIVARALGIPLVGRCGELLDRSETGNAIIVDGETGDVHLRPTGEVRAAYEAKLAMRAQRQAAYAALRDLPAVTLDGVGIALNLNAGLRSDLPHLDETGAAGIGLFRTELQFMINPRMPRLQAQADLYRAVLAAANGRPVAFRTLDVGGDKVLPYAEALREENPALGWRAIRIALDRPALLRYQARAFLLAAQGGELNVMFPMVAEVDEFVRAKEVFMREVNRLAQSGRAAPERLRLGVMIEVPALLWQLRQLFSLADFVSVGTNDLLQFLFATDRGNPRLGDRYDALSPAALSALSQIVKTGAAYKVPVTVCGEMASRPIEAMALLGLGFRSLSMTPAAVGPIKAMVRSLRIDELSEFVAKLCASPQRSVRESLKEFALNKGVAL